MWFWEVRIRVCYQCSASNILKINPVILTLLKSWNPTAHIMPSQEYKMVRWWDGEMVRWWDGEMVRFYIPMRPCPVIWFNMCILSSGDTRIIESQTYKIQRFRDSEIQRFNNHRIAGLTQTHCKQVQPNSKDFVILKSWNPDLIKSCDLCVLPFSYYRMMTSITLQNPVIIGYCNSIILRYWNPRLQTL